EYVAMRAGRINFWDSVRPLFERYDLLLTPTVSVAPFGVGKLNPDGWPQHRWDWFPWASFSYPFNFTGQPAATVPAGLTPAGLPAEAARQVAVLFTCLPNDDVVRAAYLGPDGVAAGGAAGLVTCDCSTVSPEATLEVAAGLARRSIVHMDTPMLGSQPQALSGEIFFIVGGDRTRLDTIKPYLEIMGRLHMYVGPSA